MAAATRLRRVVEDWLPLGFLPHWVAGTLPPDEAVLFWAAVEWAGCGGQGEEAAAFRERQLQVAAKRVAG